jgi:hypothetical protein
MRNKILWLVGGTVAVLAVHTGLRLLKLYSLCQTPL